MLRAAHLSAVHRAPVEDSRLVLVLAHVQEDQLLEGTARDHLVAEASPLVYHALFLAVVLPSQDLSRSSPVVEEDSSGSVEVRARKSYHRKAVRNPDHMRRHIRHHYSCSRPAGTDRILEEAVRYCTVEVLDYFVEGIVGAAVQVLLPQVQHMAVLVLSILHRIPSCPL